MSDLIQRIVDFILGLGFILPIAIFMALGAISDNRKKKQKQAGQPQPQAGRPPAQRTTRDPAPPPASPVPPLTLDLPSWMGMEPTPQPRPAPTAPLRQQKETYAKLATESQWGHTFDQQDEDKAALRWGSIFDDEPGERVRWESAFGAEKAQTNYGFRKIDWGRGFPERSSEPVVYRD